jgi:PhzF family phenazine biosynthesis protein
MSKGTRVPIVQVDAFTDTAFHGNPAAVCVLDNASRDAEWMQNVASEMNLAETAFLHPENGAYRLRWFTPTVEVDLCGHATLASAHVLWTEGYLAEGQQARFHSRSGLLTADRDGDWIELDFPAKHEQPADPPADLLKALGAKPVYIGRNQFDYLVELESEETVRALKPDHRTLRNLPVRGVIVTARSTEFDFISRFFAPGSGIDEDPVTGSAHCALAPYWGAKLGKTEMRAYQASPRGGFLRLRLVGDRVKIAGRAITVLKGDLFA